MINDFIGGMQGISSSVLTLDVCRMFNWMQMNVLHVKDVLFDPKIAIFGGN
jgi:hypothetical protein